MPSFATLTCARFGKTGKPCGAAWAENFNDPILVMIRCRPFHELELLETVNVTCRYRGDGLPKPSRNFRELDGEFPDGILGSRGSQFGIGPNHRVKYQRGSIRYTG